MLRNDQLESLARLTREIMKKRTSEYKTERITKNTIIRALIDNLKELQLNVRNIPDETELAKRIADSIKSHLTCVVKFWRRRLLTFLVDFSVNGVINDKKFSPSKPPQCMSSRIPHVDVRII